MTTLITVLVVLVFAALLYVFYRMQKRHTKFSTRVFTALGVGIVFGGLLQLIFGVDDKVVTQSMEWIGIVGQGYVSFLQMLVMPLVFISIIGAFTKMKVSEKLGKISATVLTSLLGTTAIAALSELVQQCCSDSKELNSHKELQKQHESLNWQHVRKQLKTYRFRSRFYPLSLKTYLLI